MTVQIQESLWRGARLSGPLHSNEAGHLARALWLARRRRRPGPGGAAPAHETSA
jgi:hypothetical protein